MSNHQLSVQNKKQTGHLQTLTKALKSQTTSQADSFKTFTSGQDPTEVIATTSKKHFSVSGGIDNSNSSLAKVNPIKVDDIGQQFIHGIASGAANDAAAAQTTQALLNYIKLHDVENSVIRTMRCDAEANLRINSVGRTQSTVSLNSMSITGGGFFTNNTNNDLGLNHQFTNLTVRATANNSTQPVACFLQVSHNNSDFYTATGLVFNQFHGTVTDHFCTASVDNPPRYYRIFNNDTNQADFSKISITFFKS